MKWVLDDERSVDQAIALRDAAVDGDVRLVAPSLWAYEITNGLVTATRRGRVGGEFASEALAAMLDIGVRLVDPPLADVYAVAVEADISGYDASYVALAHALRCPFWTADDSLLLAFPNHDRIREISQYVRAD